MKILADHCVYGKTVRLLRENSYDIIPLNTVLDPSVPDEDVLSLARSSGRVLLSNDKDFADIVRYPPQENQGIIVLRITPQSEDLVHRTLLHFLKREMMENIRGRLVIIRGNKIRTR